MSLSVETLQAQWELTDGNDPVFAAVDGSNCPTLPQKDRASHSLLLERGLFRIERPCHPLRFLTFRTPNQTSDWKSCATRMGATPEQTMGLKPVAFPYTDAHAPLQT